MGDQFWFIIAAIAAGVISIGIAIYLFFWVIRQNAGSAKAQQVAGWIRNGARSYLKKLYSALGIVVLIVGVIITVIFSSNLDKLGIGEFHFNFSKGLLMMGVFVMGSICSAVAGYMGMSVAVAANVRTATAAHKSINQAFRVSFYAGSVMGLAMVGLAIIGMGVIFLLTRDPGVVLGFSFGASTLALLAKAGGGIYTKSADIAADLVGKVEVGIPEDDPRNPAVVADNVGDNVGDVAGMGSDIFDSYVASTVAAMLLGTSLFKGTDTIKYTVFPLLLCGLGILASVIGIQFVHVGEKGKPGSALNRGTIITCIIFAGMVVGLVLLGDYKIGVLWATLAGLVTGVLIGFTSDFFTSDEFKPVRNTAKVSGSGAAITIINGFSYGLISIVPSIIGIALATFVSYYVMENSMAFIGPGFGIYGIGISAVGLLSVSGMVVSADAYGPIVDNARGIAEMAGMPQDVIDTADVLDSAGNTAKAITKGFAISAAALTVLALFAAYKEVIEAALLTIPGNTITNLSISLDNPMVVIGAFIGSLTPPLFSALTMLSVTNNAFEMIKEIRDQFKKFPGILAGTQLPDYDRCVSLAAEGALKSLILPAFIAILLPLAVGFLLGAQALGGFLGGSIFTGIVFALFMSNAGGLWDNAKKYIEGGQFGGPGSEAHKAAVIGDTVGDPFKDTAGPSINTLITVMSLVSSLMAPLIARYALFGITP